MLFRILLIASLLGGAGMVRAEPLTFSAALTLAERASPDLEAQTAGIEAARSGARAAGALPDPKLELGIENLPVTGPDQWRMDRDSMTMRKVGVMQEIPNAARRHASTAVAVATVAQAEAQRRVHVVAVRTAAAVAWLNRLYVERRLSLLGELQHENELFASAVQAQLAGGRGAAADLIAPKQEAADLADRFDSLQAEALKTRAALQRLLGPAGNEPLAGDPPAFAVDAVQLRSHVHTHPDLALYGPMIEVAQAQVRAAEAAKVPDWSVELSYGNRASIYSDMVSLQFTLALPVFAATRQDPLIDASRKEMHRLEAERSDMLSTHTEVLEGELSDYAVLTRQLARVREIRLPLAQQKVDFLLAGYQVNKADLSAVLSARRELIDTRLVEIELQNQRDVAAARIYLGYVEPAP